MTSEVVVASTLNFTVSRLYLLFAFYNRWRSKNQLTVPQSDILLHPTITRMLIKLYNYLSYIMLHHNWSRFLTLLLLFYHILWLTIWEPTFIPFRTKKNMYILQVKCNLTRFIFHRFLYFVEYFHYIFNWKSVINRHSNGYIYIM